MDWEVEVSNEFVAWYDGLDEDEPDSVDIAIGLLVEHGALLRRPNADVIHQSRYPNMKELRVQHEGRPYRILFAFDPRRSVYLILGGDKTIMAVFADTEVVITQFQDKQERHAVHA